MTHKNVLYRVLHALSVSGLVLLYALIGISLGSIFAYGVMSDPMSSLINTINDMQNLLKDVTSTTGIQLKGDDTSWLSILAVGIPILLFAVIVVVLSRRKMLRDALANKGQSKIK